MALSLGIVGQLSVFDAEKEPWTSFKYRYLSWIEAVKTFNMDLTDPQKLILLQTKLGDAHEVLRTRFGGGALGEEKLRAATHDKLITELDKHFDPPQSKFARRLQFQQRQQQRGESMDVYIQS